MRKDYFKGVLCSLHAGNIEKKVSLDFVTLKSYEYWIRMMRISKSFPDADDCIAIFPKERASRVLKDLSDHFERLNAEEDRIPISKKKSFVKEANVTYAGKRLRCNEEMSVAYQRRQMAVVRFNDVIDRSCSIKDISDFVRNYLCGEGIFDISSQKVFYESAMRELKNFLKENSEVDDGYFRRLNIVQKAFNLNDDEMEILMFSWIFFNKEQCSSLLDMLGSRRFHNATLPDIFPQLYPNVDFENTVSNRGTLKKMSILDDDLDISKRIGMFLDGHSGSDLDSLYFRVYDGNCVPFKKLCRKNPKVELAFNMFKHNKVGNGLNMFFYGVEGTGKTELAKAIAKELNRPLVLTNISAEGSHRENKDNSVVRSRMGSILYAATKYQKKKAILLVDEADVILNCCEKGALNFFLEQIKVPVIWISNTVNWIENSTLRRFDYSIHFDRPDSLNTLLYGALGTGKTEFAKHLARTLNRNLIIKKTSDLLNCYVGETEKAIRKMFKDAEEKKAILFLDEADSLIRDRSGATHNWEVTQVNEMLTQMENFKGIFIAATNFEGELDTASRRRFALKVKFGYLKPEGIEALWKGFFPTVQMPDAARNMRMLTPGDFNAAYATLRFYDECELTDGVILEALKSKIAYKDGREGRTMGL